MLTIYRASAGSGKTHKLAGEYLKLLFQHPAAYKRILAVTFTNKATDEMKGRIVEELYKLSSGRPSDYAEILASEYRITEERVRQRAKDTLVAILHDYAAFNISTIDSFFQHTMRTFTREIGLQGGYGIELDQELALSEAVDNLLADLEKPEHKELLGWLLRFAEDKIESGGEWNLRREILSLSRELFKETYKASGEQVSKDIEDKQALEQYKNELYAIIRPTEQQAKALGEKGMRLLSQYALQPSDFKGGSRSPLLFFEKLAKGEMKEPSATFTGLVDNEEACYSKATSSDTVQKINAAFNNGLNACFGEIVAFFNHLTDYYTAKEIVRHYYTLGILNDVASQIAAYRTEKNIMLIADTTELLNKIIDGSDTPFIYEKIGTHIEHYMIDEFQDTSGMQWNNFRPLIEESLAHRRSNLIVGDVKQSIYRFRNSDWELLDKQVQKDFRMEQVKEETLQENWRSFKRIVEFNNALFAKAPALLQAMYDEALAGSSLPEEEKQKFYSGIVAAYRHSEQLVAPVFQHKEGHVAVEFLPDDDEADWKQKALERLLSELERLQDNGYALKDIAILVRTNQEGATVANALLAYRDGHPSARYRYDIISDDALYVSRSPAVRFVIAMLKCLKSPGDLTSRQRAFFACSALTGDFAEAGEASDFPEDIKKALHDLSRHSLYEMTEGLFRLFPACFPDSEQAFVQALFDMIAEFSQKENPDLNRFLKWWEETGVNKTIATPDGQDAIRILTIHKSKGLGFKAVIIPFCDWEIDHKPAKPVIIWCRPEKKPFNRLHLTPVRYGQALAKTIFASDYFEERLRAYIDNLNILYVAFTRAKEELLIFAPRPKKAKEEGVRGTGYGVVGREEGGGVEKISSIADLLWASLGGDFESGATSIVLPAAGREEGKSAEEISLGRNFSVSPDERLHLRLHGKSFFSGNAQRKHGALMHEILSNIRTKEDIPPAVDGYYRKGFIGKEEAESLVARLETLLTRPDVAGWYDGKGQVLNEVEILCGKEPARRPDRVIIKEGKVTVIDYKFGKRKDRRHHLQVADYLQRIRQMGYSETEGFLWYVELGATEPV